MSSGSGFNHPPKDDGPSYSEIKISAIICLLLVVLLVFLLHVFARWIWRQCATFTRWRRWRSARRRRLYFTGEEPESLRNVGLDSAILENLPIFVYESQNFTDGLECAVCLCELEENEKARLLPNCRHSFHVGCIDMWFLSHSTCPLCRIGAKPEQPVLKSDRTQQVSAAIPGRIPSRIHDNVNSEQGIKTAACSEEEYNVQSPTNILCWSQQEQTNSEMDEGTSVGRALMPHLAIEIPKKPDGIWSPGEGHQLHSPNGSQSPSKSPVTRLSSLNRETKVYQSDHPGKCEVENNCPAQAVD